MGKRRRKQFQEHKDPMDKEIKYFVTLVLLAFVFISFLPMLGQQAQPLRFLDGIIQYAEAAEFYIPPDVKITAHHTGTGTSCPSITGPASADTTDPSASMAFWLEDSAGSGGCYFPVYIWDEGSILPRVFDQAILDAGTIYGLTDWSSTAFNLADNLGGGVGCSAVSVANRADPRINVTDTYDAIRTRDGGTVGGLSGACDSDIVESSSRAINSFSTLDTDFVNRVNDTYYAIGGIMGTETNSRDISDRRVPLAITDMSLNFAFQIPANHSNNWWQMQEHPMFINEIGTPTGDQFSDNDPALIDSGFFGIDGTTFTFDTGLDAVERGQVVLFKQFNKTVIGERDFRVEGGIQSVTALGDTKIRIEVRDHAVQAGQSLFFGSDIHSSVHDGQDYFHKNRPIKYLNNGSLGVIDFEPTSLGAVEPFDISIAPEWNNSISEIVTLIITLQDNSTTGSLIGNVTAVEVENIIRYDFNDINDLLFFEDNCSANFANVDQGQSDLQNDENCGIGMSNGLVNIQNVTLSGAIAGTLPTPAAVTGLTVGVITDDSLVLRWTHDDIDTTGFRIDRDDGSGLVEYIKTTTNSTSGIGGSLEHEFIDINYVNYPSKANALGLEENTEYSYRVCALNGDVVGTCSSTVAQTTPDSEPFWQIVEYADAGNGAGILVTHTGGDGDWIEFSSGLTNRGERDGYLLKSFNITEYGLIDKNSFATYYIDWQEDSDNGIRSVRFCDGDINRFDTTHFLPTGADPLPQCRDALTKQGHNEGGGDAFGDAGDFEPVLVGRTVNLNSTFFPSGFVTVMFTSRDSSTILDQGWQIKNFTWINSTTWEFESGNGASLNWTAGVNRDNENNIGGSYSSPQFSNCNRTNTDSYIDMTYGCDLGTIEAVSATHQILRLTDDEDDWHYHETSGIEAGSPVGFGGISSNSSGLVIDFSRSVSQKTGPLEHDPVGFGKFFIWNTFPKSVLQEGNVTINVRGETIYNSGIGIQLNILNSTVNTLNDALIDRWSPNQWSENNFGTIPSGPSPSSYCLEVLHGTCNVGGLDINGALIARDGDEFTPFDPIRVSDDFSAFTNTTDTITVIMQITDNSNIASGIIIIENVTVGLTTYNFTDSTVQNEIGENQFERITKENPLDYQKFHGVASNDIGLVTAGSLIIEPPPVPTGLNATADFDRVFLQWDERTSNVTQSYKIERADVDVNATNFSVLVPNLIEANIESLSDDFSSYATNATGDLVWIPTKAGTDSADDIIGVNATADNLHFHANTASASQVTFDLFDLLGQNLTNTNGVGDFNMTWTHQLLAHESTFADTGELKVTLTDRQTAPTTTQTGIQVGFFHRETGFTQSAVLRVAEDNTGFLGFDAIDGNCGLGQTTFIDVAPNDNIADTPITVYETLSKVGQVLTYNVGINDDYGGLGCTVSSTATETFDDLRYLVISRANSGSASDDDTFVFDDFSLSTNGSLVNFYYDDTVDLGTSYSYRISALNNDDSTESAPSDPANVLTNDIPEVVQNTVAEFATPTQIDVQWDALAFNSGEGLASTGLNLTKYQIFRQNLTSGDPFVLAGEVFASSPPPNFFNDTGVAFPSTFSYEISACNGLGCSANSTSSTASIVDPPEAVLDTPVFNATAVDATVSLDWNDAAFAVNYTVLRNNTIIAQGVPTSDYIDSSVSVNTNYNYSAWGVNDNGNGTTGTSNVVLTNDVPTEPLNFSVEMGMMPPYLETPILNWTIPVDQGDGSPTTSVPIINYTVERKAGIGAFSFLKAETNVNQNGTTDDTAVVAANYTWKVQACNSVGCSPFSNTFSIIVTPITVPEAPTNLTTTTLSGTEIFLDWTAPISNATNAPSEYRIQQRHVGFTGFVTLLDTGNLDTNYTATGLLAGNTYDYRVAGVSGAGQGDWSNIAQNTTFTVPTSPQNVTATTLSQTQIRLDWDEPIVTNGGIVNYTIDVASSPFTFVANTTNTTFTVGGLTTKTTYDFRINATNLIGYGAYSQNATNTTFGVPDAPINEAGDTNGINEITVSWDEGANNFGSAVTGYRIDQALQGGTWVTAINDTGNNVEPLEETFVGLLPQTTYTYRIFAYNSFGISLPTANLTQGTFTGPTEPENFFAVFNATKPYSVNLSWSAPLNDGGRPIIAYLIQRQNESGVYVQIANVTNSTFAYTDTSLLNLATHTYRIAAQTNPIGSFTPDQPVATFVPANIVNFTIDEFGVVGDVLQQNYSFVVDDCFPVCTLSQADIERNGIVESNYVLSEAVPLDTEIEFTTWFVLPTAATSSINTTAIVTNLGGFGDDEAGVTLATAEFLVPDALFFNHTRTPDFEDIEFQLIRHPVPWEVSCEHTIASALSPSILGISGSQPNIVASGIGVGYLNETINANPQAHSYIACFDPNEPLNKVQILSFTSFGLGNGTFALVNFTSQLGNFLGVPVAFVFVIFLAAIWTGRSASTGIIFLAVAIGFMGFLGYFPDINGDPLLTGGFWSLIVLLTALGVFLGKRFF